MTASLRLLAGLAALAAVPSLGSCSPVESATGAAAPVPELRMADRQLVDNLMPPKYAENDARLLYPCLFVTGSHGELVPDLAREVPSQANGAISKDGLTIDYRLRHDVRWADGVPLTADDVVFTQHAVMADDNLFPFHVGYSDVASIAAPDPYTVRVRMKFAYSPILHKLFAQNFCYGIIPQHVFRDAGHLARLPADAQPVVAGPFLVETWKRGDHLVLKPNPTYFGGPPHVQIIAKYITGSSTIVAQMKTGELDADFDAKPVEAVNLQDDPNVTIARTTAPNVDELILNLADPILKDVRFRRALEYALDRNTIARKVSYGYYDPSMVAPAIFGWAYDPTAQQPSYDLQRANALLDSLGWLRGPDGMRARNGQPLQLVLTSLPHEPNVDVLIQSDLARAGIGLVIKMIDESQLYSDVTIHGKFQLIYIDWSFQGWDSDLSPLLACDMFPPEGGNYGHFCDPRFDAANRAAYSTFDPVARRKHYAVAQRIFYEDVPQILLWGRPTIDIYTKRLKNFADSDGDTFFHANGWELAPR